MNAQLIVCDEIGGVDEAQAILAAQNCGVPLLATAHAGSMEGLMRRTGIRLLCESGVFGAYVGIRRRTDKSDYLYTVTEVKDDFQTPWSGDTVI
jgi:stage III sporulation protein AA